jgi:ubiquinone/menaquinone biosynthesis C-methylase UbiE
MGRTAWSLRAAFYDRMLGLPLLRRIREGERECFRELIHALPLENARILDLACGTGDYLGQLGDGRVYGLDYSQEMLRIASGRGGAMLVLGDAHHLPFKAGCLDLVVCIGLLEYLGDVEAVLREIGRVLRKNGHGVVSYSRKSPLNLLRYLLGSRVNLCTGEELAISLNKCSLEWVSGRELLLQGQVLCRKT